MECMKRFFTLSGFLMLALLTAACGDLVLPDQDTIEALREAKFQSTVFSVEGTVVNQEGQPLEGITVVVSGYFRNDTEIYPGRNYKELDTLTTDAAGFYCIPKRSVTPAFTDLDIYAFDSLGIYEPGRCLVPDLKIGTVAPTISLIKKQDAQ